VQAELAAALTALEPVIGRAESEPEPLAGGITNRNFHLRIGGHDVVVRLPGKDTELLGIDRVAEREATAAAARAGMGPEVVAFLVAPPCLVTRFIPGRSLAAEELHEPAVLSQVAAGLRAFHAGPPLPARFDAFAIVDGYHATAVARGAPIPTAYPDLIAGAHAIRAALTGPEHAPVPCHDDLLTANFLHDGERVRIVDWEYAGMGDRYFDLANLAGNNGFSEADDAALLGAYWQESPTDARFAALQLMRVMSEFREGMWAVVQGVVSELEFDLGGYATELLERVRAGLEDPRLDVWLEAARAG
jgi:thiamine kinase-like enzyme